MRALSNAGMKVVFTYLTDKHKEETLDIVSKGDNAGIHAIKLDIADRNAWGPAANPHCAPKCSRRIRTSACPCTCRAW